MATTPQSQEPRVLQPWYLPEYLEGQEKGVPICRERYEFEFQAFTYLGELFDKLAEAWRPQDRPLADQERLRLIFLYCVKQQMYGAVFLLLRLRTVDALAGTRYAIEATALAHHLWKKPERQRLGSGLDFDNWESKGCRATFLGESRRRTDGPPLATVTPRSLTLAPMPTPRYLGL